MKDFFVRWFDKIAVSYHPGSTYPQIPPFHPSQRYPEAPWDFLSEQPNEIYDSIRNTLYSLGLDRDHFNTHGWNPLKDFIHPGDTVLIKPNFVLHFHPKGEDINSVVTHPSVIRAILDYIIIALADNGRIIIGDAPIQSCRIEQLLNQNHLLSVLNFVQENCSISIGFRDLRELVIRQEKHSIITSRSRNVVETTIFNLGKDSKLEGIVQDAYRFAVDDYNPQKTAASHGPGKHLYDLNALTFQVDAIISIPKLKTHKRSGITAAIKNFVGLNANKERLPHFRKGSAHNGGDEYPETNIFRELYRQIRQWMAQTDNKLARYIMVSILYLERRIFTMMKFPLIEGGAWPGNDTLWRMVYDLNKIIYFGDGSGKLHNGLQRKVFHLVDGIVAGENYGPLEPSPKPSGIIIAGFNPFLVDAIACEMIGFDYRKIKSVSSIQEIFPIEIEDACIWLNGEPIPFDQLNERVKLAFIPPTGWEEIVRC